MENNQLDNSAPPNSELPDILVKSIFQSHDEMVKLRYPRFQIYFHKVQVSYPSPAVKSDWLCRARLALVILPPTTLWLITPVLPLFSASIVHRFSCYGTPFSCNGISSSSAFLPPISYIYRGPSALQNKQSSHTAYPVQQLWARANYCIFDLKLRLHHSCDYIIVAITSSLKPHRRRPQKWPLNKKHQLPPTPWSSQVQTTGTNGLGLSSAKLVPIKYRNTSTHWHLQTSYWSLKNPPKHCPRMSTARRPCSQS